MSLSKEFITFALQNIGCLLAPTHDFVAIKSPDWVAVVEQGSISSSGRWRVAGRVGAQWWTPPPARELPSFLTSAMAVLCLPPRLSNSNWNCSVVSIKVSVCRNCTEFTLLVPHFTPLSFWQSSVQKRNAFADQMFAHCAT